MSEICRRFGSRNDMQRSFNKLAQEKDVEDFIKKFEELNPYLSKANFISSFISGLKELKILKPTLNQVFDEAKWQEEYFFSMAGKNKFVSGMGDECKESAGRGK